MGPISLGDHHHCSHGQHLSSGGGLWMSGWADGRTGGWTDGQLSVFLVSLLGRTLGGAFGLTIIEMENLVGIQAALPYTWERSKWSYRRELYRRL